MITMLMEPRRSNCLWDKVTKAALFLGQLTALLPPPGKRAKDEASRNGASSLRGSLEKAASLVIELLDESRPDLESSPK